MRAYQAVDLINRTTFRPGWKFSAKPSGYYSPYSAYSSDYYPGQESGSTIDLMITIETVDTSYPGPDGTYTVPRTLHHDVPLDVDRFETEDDLLRHLLRYVREIDEHEDRELLRVRQEDGSYKAPFHPHREDGERRWRGDRRLRPLGGTLV